MKKVILFSSLITLSGLAIAAGHADHGGAKEHASDGKEKMHKGYHGKQFAKMDANGDEKIDLQEFLANSERRFNKMDADGDGFVSMKEAREMRKAMKSERAHKMMEDHKKGAY